MVDDYFVKRPQPRLEDLLEIHKKDVALSINCHAVATVQVFNSQDQTIQATINYKRTYFLPDPDSGALSRIDKEYPLLVSVPVISIRGGVSGLTMPILPGDQCIIFFNDRSLDEWFVTGKNLALDSFRTHDITDGIALIGLSHSQNPLQNFDSQNPVLYNGKTQIVLKANKVLLKNQTESLNAILQDLIIAIKTLSTLPTSPGNPATLDAPTILNLSNIATRLGGLLE